MPLVLPSKILCSILVSLSIILILGHALRYLLRSAAWMCLVHYSNVIPSGSSFSSSQFSHSLISGLARAPWMKRHFTELITILLVTCGMNLIQVNKKGVGEHQGIQGKSELEERRTEMKLGPKAIQMWTSLWPVSILLLSVCVRFPLYLQPAFCMWCNTWQPIALRIFTIAFHLPEIMFY